MLQLLSKNYRTHKSILHEVIFCGSQRNVDLGQYVGPWLGRELGGGGGEEYIHIFVLCPTNFF